MVLTVDYYDEEEKFIDKYIDTVGVKTPCVSKNGGAEQIKAALGPTTAGVSYLIEPDRTYWSSYNGQDNYKTGLILYNNAIGTTLTEMGVKPHDHKVSVWNNKLANSNNCISVGIKGQKLFIKVPHDDMVKVKLFSANGQLVYTYEKRMFKAGSNLIDLSNRFSCGMYIVSIEGAYMSYYNHLLVQ